MRRRAQGKGGSGDGGGGGGGGGDDDDDDDERKSVFHTPTGSADFCWVGRGIMILGAGCSCVWRE